jgi:hypothetical protein
MFQVVNIYKVYPEKNNNLYLGYSNSSGVYGIIIVDITVISNPFSINTFSLSEKPSISIVKNDNLYISERNNGLRIYDISNSSNPVFRSFINTLGSPYGIDIEDSFLYLACTNSGMRLIDISSPSSPLEIGYYQAQNLYAYKVIVKNGIAYTTNGNYGIAIIGNENYTTLNSTVKNTKKYTLLENYPNPFNPITTIHYEIPINSKVMIKIFNIKGQLITQLIDKQMPAGTHKIQWSGTNSDGVPVNSGVYFYQITAGKYSQTRKMILLK